MMSYIASIDFVKVEKTDKTAGFPTGYSPSALPFYQALDDQEFEQFCTDLLNLHPVITLLKDGKATQRNIVEATRLLSGNAQKGADIKAKDDQGAVWYFQCKHTTAFVESQVSSTIKLAEGGFPQADQFVLVTTCGLNENAQAIIDEHRKWRWWDASRLTTEISILRPREDAINLVHRFFGPDWVKRLFPCSDQPLLNWQEFFRRDLRDTNKHFRHTIPFVPWTDALTKLQAFAQSGAGHALILSAAGGQGKSRLLLELAQHFEKKPQSPRVRFLNLNQHGLSGEQSDFLAGEEEDLLLIVDDAHRMGEAIGDIAQAAEKVKPIRLLIATRPQAVDAIRSQLYQNGYNDRIEEPLRLPSWQWDDILRLAEQVLTQDHRSQENTLASLADRCPLLVVLGADLMNSGEGLEALRDERAFRERVFKSFKDDFLHTQPEAKQERLNRVISLLSFVSPTPKNDALLVKVAEILGCSALDIDEDLGALESAGLIVENREGIRLYPDLFADAVLLDACLDNVGRPTHMHKTVINKLSLDDFPALMRNIAQADWEARSRQGTSYSLFDPIWHEFVDRFEKGSWVHDESDFLDQYLAGVRNLDTDRSEMLAQWAPVAVFLPERTLELTELAMKSAATSANDRACACRDLPPLLKPIVVSHAAHAKRALDLLWYLATLQAESTKESGCVAINTIAEAAAFELRKPIEVSERVLAWLEQEIKEPSTIEFLRRQPWISSALLKPFFVREVQNAWYPGKGDKVFTETGRLRAEKARPIRQRALNIAEKLLKSPDTVLGCAVVPVLAEAIKPNGNGPRSLPDKTDQESWRQARLDVLKVIEGAVEARHDSPTLLLQLRGVLRNRPQLEQDPVVKSERDRIAGTIPSSLELRVQIVLSSYAHFEFPVHPGPKAASEREEAKLQWAEFTRATARELFERSKTPHQLCEFLRRAGGELKAINQNVYSGELLEHLAQMSPSWCDGLLKELVGTEEPVLDGGLRAVLSYAFTAAPEAYREAVERLPAHGKAVQLCELIGFLGWKQLHGGGLAPVEHEAILAAVKRKEDPVVCELAWLCELPSNNDPRWSVEVLSQLQPGGERSGDLIIEALGIIVKEHGPNVESQKVAECLDNLGEYCFPESGPISLSLTNVSERFPRQVYEHVRRLYERAESDLGRRHRLHISEIPSLGPLGDAEYVDREIHALWDRAVTSEADSFSQEFRLALIRSLLWADAASAPDRLRQFVTTCKNGDEIKLFAKLVGIRPSRFVFNFPDVVRSILARGQELGAMDEVTKTLLLAACGGGRTYSDSELDPEYKYILEQGDALANRYSDDRLLQSFYRAIANWERSDLEQQRQRRSKQDY
jgi:hypothetical protein